jgi:hypothetical protein
VEGVYLEAGFAATTRPTHFSVSWFVSIAAHENARHDPNTANWATWMRKAQAHADPVLTKI